jgi:hypothetical protein
LEWLFHGAAQKSLGVGGNTLNTERHVTYLPPCINYWSGFGGLVVSMLASGTRVRGFKPSEKILSMPSFGREVKPHAADLRHVKESCDYMEVGSQAKLAGHFSPDISTFRY